MQSLLRPPGPQQVKETDLGKMIEHLRSNRTVMVLPLNADAGQDPKLTRCETVKEVFETFKPQAEIAVRNEDGEVSETVLEFRSIPDFGPEAVTKAEPELRRQKHEIAILQDLLKQARQNAALRRALGKDDERRNLIEGLKTALEILGRPGEGR